MTGLNDAASWLRADLRKNLTEEFSTMADFEREIDRKSTELRRLVLEQAVQELTDKQPLGCPRCKRPLQIVDRNRPRTVETSFGKISYTRGTDSVRSVSSMPLRLMCGRDFTNGPLHRPVFRRLPH